MKNLESVRIVQFYLFDQLDVRLSEITGIFGPNASGKSSLLDAIQTAMFGGHARWAALNAQAEDHATARSLRAYCLGQVGQGDENRARDNALTYITLIWRDTVTQEPTSMGVCISASADRDGHEVLGRYLLRGVELSMSDHLEVVDEATRPRSWATFRLMLKQRAMPGETDVEFADAERYLQAYLFALRGDKPLPKDAFRKAFRFALRMRFDKSLDAIVRDDVLEARPTQIAKFKEVTESFRRLKELVEQLQRKLDVGTAVESLYTKIAEESRNYAAWGALEKEALVGQCTDALDAASAACEAAETEHRNRSAEHRRLSTERDEAFRNAEDARARKEAHAFHKDVGQLEKSMREQRDEIKTADRTVGAVLSLLARALRQALGIPILAAKRDQLEDAAREVDQLQATWTTVPAEDLQRRLRTALAATGASFEQVSRHIHDKTSELNQAKENLELDRKSLLRVERGQAPLQRSTEELRKALEDQGIPATPVCDLVTIKDASWQPVIEAFLQRNAEALLVAAKDEKKAFQVYRYLDKARQVYGAKLVLPSKQDTARAPAAGTVAELIVGTNPTAVAFLRQQFGPLRRTESDEETLAESRTLTKDGMLLRGGAVERLRLVQPSEFRIGGGTAHQREALLARISEQDRLIRHLDAALQEANALQAALKAVASADLVVDQVLQSRSKRQRSEQDVELTEALLRDQADPEYLNLAEEERKHRAEGQRLQGEVSDAATAMGQAETLLGTATQAVEAARGRLADAVSQSDVARVEATAADVDSDLMERLRERALVATDKSFAAMAHYCGNQQKRASDRQGEKSREAAREFAAFCLNHREAPGPGVVGDWRREQEWLADLLTRLRDTQLVPYRKDMDDAFARSQETFRNDVAVVLADHLDWLDETLNRLSRVLRECPAFSNGERYRFKRTVRPNLDPLLQFVRNVAQNGPTQDLLGGPGEVPDEFRRLLEERTITGGAGLPSPLEDFRQFFDFDVEILREDPMTGDVRHIGLLSKRIGPGSGGEHRAPLYVIAGAALASAYRLEKGQPAGLRLIMLDEAFNKMDMGNIIATMRYLEELGLQVLLASPGENLGVLNSFLHRYYTIDRDPINNTVMLDARELTAEAREQHRADLWEFNPELVDAEVRAMSQAA